MSAHSLTHSGAPVSDQKGFFFFLNHSLPTWLSRLGEGQLVVHNNTRYSKGTLMHVFCHRFEHLSVFLSNVCLFDSTTTAADSLHCSGGLASLRLCQCHCSHCLGSVSRVDITVTARLRSLSGFCQ